MLIIKNKFLLFLVFILILYILIFYICLDKLDKISIYYLIRYKIFYNKIEYSIYKILYTIYLFILTPFKYNMYFSHISEGGIYYSYIFKYYPKLGCDMNKKLYWNKIFNKNDINHPKLVAYIIDNKLYKLDNIIEDENYICKPNYGALGYKIFKIKGKEIKQSKNKYNNVIFQQMLKDCMSKEVRHFRYVSLHNGTSFTLYELVAKDNSIVSNHSAGGTENKCTPISCEHLTKKENNEINQMIKKLSELHKKLYPMIFSIGWDIMLDCSNKILKSYCLEGNIGHSTWNYPEPINKKLILSYKNKCYNFLDKNKYI